MMDLDEQEITILRYLANFYTEHGNPTSMDDQALEFDQVRERFKISESEARRILGRFEHFGLIEIKAAGAVGSWIKFDTSLFEAARQADAYEKNPPPRDRPNEIKSWAYSKWWIVPVVLFVVGVRWAVEIVSGLQLILKWFGATGD